MEPDKGYVLITPFKNERAMVDGLFESVTALDPKPVLWLLADDKSTDGGYERAQALAAGHPWIVVVTREPVDVHPLSKIGSAVSFALNEALRVCEQRGLDPEMIALIDADTVVEPGYYGRLVSKMKSEERVGIVAGMITTEGGSRLESRPLPRACARLYSREFIEGIGGIPVAPAWDTVLEIKAESKGYSFKIVPEAKGVHRRSSTGITGQRGLRTTGAIRYALGMDMLSAFAWFVMYSRALGLKQGSSFLAGYLSGVRTRSPRTDDADVIAHFRGSWKRFFTKRDTRTAMADLLGSSE